jgi:putative membrane protein
MVVMVKALAIKWAVLAVAIWVTTAIISGVDVNGGVGTYLLVAAIFATVNTLLGSILRLLSFPIVVLTLGVFSLVITAFMLLVTDWLMDTFDVDGFGSAFAAAIVIAVVTMVLDFVLPTSKEKANR